MHQQREQRGSHHDARGIRPDRPQNSINDGIEHTGVRHDAKKQNGEDEHSRHAGHALNAVQHERRSLRAEAADQRRYHRKRD